MKLMIAVPTHDYVHADFMECLLKLQARLIKDGIDYDIRTKKGTLVYAARDKIALEAISEGFTHVLWLDSDMVFNDGIVDDLSFCGKDFVTGICHSRRFPFVSCIFHNLNPIVRHEGNKYPHAPFEIKGCGFACVLIKTECLRNVKNKFGTCFLPMAEYGEDLAFCKRFTDIGGKIYADPAAQIGHIGHITIYPGDVEQLSGGLVNGC